MNNWIFESVDTSFSLCLPKNWSEYVDEENVCAFFNQEKWSGNLRITSFRWNDEQNAINKASEYMQSELKENSGAKQIKIGDWDAVFYSKDTVTENEVIYYWVTGIEVNLFLISFTFDKDFLTTERHKEELHVVVGILNSIKIL